MSYIRYRAKLNFFSETRSVGKSKMAAARIKTFVNVHNFVHKNANKVSFHVFRHTKSNGVISSLKKCILFTIWHRLTPKSRERQQ